MEKPTRRPRLSEIKKIHDAGLVRRRCCRDGLVIAAEAPGPGGGRGPKRPFVVVVELDRSLDARYDTRMHIAPTRATAGWVALAAPIPAA